MVVWRNVNILYKWFLSFIQQRFPYFPFTERVYLPCILFSSLPESIASIFFDLLPVPFSVLLLYTIYVEVTFPPQTKQIHNIYNLHRNTHTDTPCVTVSEYREILETFTTPDAFFFLLLFQVPVTISYEYDLSKVKLAGNLVKIHTHTIHMHIDTPSKSVSRGTHTRKATLPRHQSSLR